MAYYLNLFDARTWDTTEQGAFKLCGFSPRQRSAAAKVQPGDVFLCYLVGLSRWCGALRVTSTAFDDPTPFYSDPDPWTVRFSTEPLVTLAAEAAVPIFEDELWSGLSATRALTKAASGWAVAFRSSLRLFSDDDAELVLRSLRRQASSPQPFPYSERDRKALARRTAVPSPKGDIVVEVPDSEEVEPHGVSEAVEAHEVARASLSVQATLARVGAALGFKIWIAPGDRRRVADLLGAETAHLLDRLPVNYESATLSTVEQLDVIWIKGRSIVRAFEVEHTTAVYSGLLRMADLLALQPNLAIKLHIVAPDDKREKVLRELRRPVFALLERGPLYESCTYIPYSSLRIVADLKHLSHMNDTVLDEFEERATE
jgi:hypothetical protein